VVQLLFISNCLVQGNGNDNLGDLRWERENTVSNANFLFPTYPRPIVAFSGAHRIIEVPFALAKGV
jgi:hypothetical protein